MATLYVRNVPDDLYKALRNRAKANRRSIAAEVLALLQENVPTEKELRARRKWLRKLLRLREEQSKTSSTFLIEEVEVARQGLDCQHEGLEGIYPADVTHPLWTDTFELVGAIEVGKARCLLGLAKQNQNFRKRLAVAK